MTSKLNARHIISTINLHTVATVRYGTGILKLTEKEQKEMDKKSRKLLTMHGVHHPRVDTDCLYMKRTNRGREPISVEDCMFIVLESLMCNPK